VYDASFYPNFWRLLEVKLDNKHPDYDHPPLQTHSQVRMVHTWITKEVMQLPQATDSSRSYRAWAGSKFDHHYTETRLDSPHRWLWRFQLH
jgi:hypothetical protein